MKKLLFIFAAALLFMVGCSSDESASPEEDEGEELTAHINISDEIIGDSYQVMRIIEKAVEADEKPEMEVLDDYSEKYVLGYDDLDLTDEEAELVLATGHLILNANKYVTIASERKDFEKDKKAFYETLKTGEFNYQRD